MTQTTKKTTTKKRVVKRVKLPPNPFIHEILDLVGEQRTKAKRVDILKEYRDESLLQFLFGTLMIEFSLQFLMDKFLIKRMKYQ